MRKSSLGRRSQVEDGKLRRTLERKSAIPRPQTRTSRSSSETRESGAKWGMSGMKRSKSQLSLFTPNINAFTPQMARSYLTVGSAGSTASTMRCPTPSGSEASYSSIKSSVYGPHKPMKDTRNLGDKSFQQQAIQQVTNFLITEPQAHVFLPNPPNLRQLMLKNFVDIVNYLVRCIDITVCINMSNYVEEIPPLMRTYGYPGTINQSWLKTANTQHAFPHVLGLLSWLVTLVQAQREVSYDDFFVAFVSDFPDIFTFSRPEVYMKYFFTQFSNFNGDENAMEDVQSDFIETLMLNNGFGDEVIENLMKETTALRAQANNPAFVADMENFTMCESKLNALAKDCAQSLAHKAQLDEYISSVDTVLLEEKAKLHSKEERMICLNEKLEALRNQLKTQVMSVAERDELMNACKELSAAIRENDELIIELQNAAYKDDIDLTRKREKLRKKSQAYNKTIIVEACWLPDLKNLQVENSILHADAKEQLAAIDSAACALRDKLLKQLEDVNSRCSLIVIELARNEENLQKLLEERRLLEEQVSKKDTNLKTLKKRCTEEEAYLKEMCCKIDTEIKLLLDSTAIVDAERCAANAIESAERGENAIVELCVKAEDFFRKSVSITETFMDDVNKVEQEVMQKIQDLKSSMEKTLESVQDM